MPLAVLAVLASGLTAAVAAVVAFEAQIVQVGTSVSNALVVPTGNSLEFNESFPQEFRRDVVLVELSQSFKAAPRAESGNVEVWIECRPDFPDGQGGTVDVKWLGDFAYLAKTDPGTQLPGGADQTPQTPATGGPLPPRLGGVPNAPWEHVGGTPDDCDPGAAIPNKIGVFTAAGAGGGPITLLKTDPPQGAPFGVGHPSVRGKL